MSASSACLWHFNKQKQVTVARKRPEVTRLLLAQTSLEISSCYHQLFSMLTLLKISAFPMVNQGYCPCLMSKFAPIILLLALSHPVPYDAPSLSLTVPHDGPRYPYDGAGDSDKPWLVQAGEISILGSRHTVHHTAIIICNMGMGQHRLLLLHFFSRASSRGKNCR